MHGIYRITDMPLGPREDLHKYALWLRGRDGELQGAFGLETALSIYELSDFMPSRIHVIAKDQFKRSVIPQDIVLHKVGFDTDKWRWHEGLPVQKALSALHDMLALGGWDEEALQQAYREGRRLGIIHITEIEDLTTIHPRTPTIKTILSWKIKR